MKAAVGITRTHNPSEEVYWASCLRENLTSSSYGEGLETGRVYPQVPRQSLTRQNCYHVGGEIDDSSCGKGDIGNIVFDFSIFRSKQTDVARKLLTKELKGRLSGGNLRLFVASTSTWRFAVAPLFPRFPRSQIKKYIKRIKSAIQWKVSFIADLKSCLFL